MIFPPRQSGLLLAQRDDWGWIPIVHCGRPFNAVIKPLLSNIKYCRHCWWTSWYCWSSQVRAASSSPRPRQSGPANIRFLCSIRQLQMSDQRRDIVNLFSSFLISVKIEFNPRPNSDHDPDQPWRLGVSSEPQLWDRSHEIHFDIIKDCRGLVSDAEVIRIREMSLLMS